LRHKSAGTAVIWDEGLPEAQVSQRLAAASIAYLPYPDGASERRATLKAALLNGVAVVTTQGPATPKDLENVVEFAGSPRHALEIILTLLSDELGRSRLGRQGVRYAEKFSWAKIAQDHNRIYSQFVGRHAIEALHTASAQIKG
jgi:glycosyltransferase involved in cell wall biosynthesis